MRLRPSSPGRGSRPGRTMATVATVATVAAALVLGLVPGAAAKKDEPGVSVSRFKSLPYNLQYFEDSDVVLFEDDVSSVVYRSDDAGEHWSKISGVAEGTLMELIMHPFDSKRAYIISNQRVHWTTKDRGASWQQFASDVQASIWRPALSFHAGDPDRLIFNGMACSGIFCEELTMYTTDDFASEPKFLRADTAGCHWAQSSSLFTTGQKDLDRDRILCVVKGQFSPWKKDYRLLISDDFFGSVGDDIQEFEPELEPGRTVQGIVNMAVIKKYLIAAATAEGTDEMALYTSDDAIKWHRAVFPHDHKLTEEAYTVLEGTDYSIQLDVMNTNPARPMGVFLSSNSNGTYFTRNIEHTNRNMMGLVDFENIAGIQGIMLVNVVDNWEAVMSGPVAKQVRSQISFDDGRNWNLLTYGNKEIHLHSVTALENSGRVFSSPAPGLVLGVGNTGDYLKPYEDGNLYVSDDAGLTWEKALDGPYKYEFGDQGSILVAVKDGVTDEVRFSLDHGKTWSDVDIGQKFRPLQVTTTQDSTSLKFIIVAAEASSEPSEAYIIALDFDDMHEAQCTSKDMEDWFARVDQNGEPTCLMGHKQSYRRRKADADCFIKKEFEDPVPVSTPCTCTNADFECDFNFVRSEDRTECIRAGSIILPEGECKAFGPDDTFMGSSGWRLIPGNDCERTSGKQKDDLVKTKCSEAVGKPASGAIDHKQEIFTGDSFKNKIYLERTGISAGEDETVIVRTDKGSVYMSKDHGKSWDEILEDAKIEQIYTNPYFNDIIYFLTSTSTVYYSIDRGDNIRSFDTRREPNREGLPIMSFHPKNKDWIIWTGAQDCDRLETCHSVASLTKDRGDEWQTLQRYVRKCEFIRKQEGKTVDENLIYCEVRKHESNELDNPWLLVSSSQFFADTPKVHFDNIIDFATMSEFIVVAAKDEEHQTLKVDASVDGEIFAEALFPHGFNVDHQQAYTVLDSSTHSVFLHVTVNNDAGLEYGTIIKSNSNGTSYVLSLNAVDRDSKGYVDFEKMSGLEGVAMVNVVANYEDKSYSRDGKKLKTMITHNDGAEWEYLPPPKADADGKGFDCSGGLDKCSLNIHGYTERFDKSHTFSSSSAIGLMMGVGNVGQYLTEPAAADTYMTTDGGISWKSVKKGKYMWEFGDQGSIIVIVKERAETNMVYYSLDEGDSWVEYKFSDHNILIEDITTVPSDNSRNFLLWGHDDDKLTTINIDLSGLTDVQCTLDEKNVEGGDYYLWTPKHPKQKDDCLFGHVAEYHRKRVDSHCYNGRMIPHLHNIAKNCSCTRQDFECDFNFERQADGSCALVRGYSPRDHSAICREDDAAIEWYDPTGYRRIPLTTCQGGKEMDVSVAHPCSGHEDDFNEKHSATVVAVFFAVVIPFALAAGVGYYVYSNWTNKFGQIRLGEQSSMSGESPLVKYPIIAISAVVAVAQALPLLLSSLWRTVSGFLSSRGGGRRFTTRDSFARGRGEYTVVDEDEGELLGEDSDEEV